MIFMSERLTINYAKKPCYDIVFTNSFDELLTELSLLEIAEKKFVSLQIPMLQDYTGMMLWRFFPENAKRMYCILSRQEKKTKLWIL